jgi:hypothetical protein
MVATPAYPQSTDVQLYIDSVWTSIGAYVIGNIEADDGISGNRPADKMGRIGGMSLTLNNNSGLFVPGAIGAMTGFRKGAKIRIVITFEDLAYIKFKGRITKIGLPYDANGASVVPVSASDWFYTASKQVAIGQGIETNITTVAAAAALLTHAPTQPDATDIEVSGDTLESAFHSMSPKSTVYSELAKLAASEFAYYYLKRDRTYGETLRIERRNTRVSVPVTQFPKPISESDTLLLISGNDFSLISGDLLALNQTTSITFDSMYGAEVEYGDNLINELTVRQNLTRVDSSTQVLFSLDAPIYIAAGSTIPDFRVSYKNPTGGSGRINGVNMIAPVSGTDYKMYTNSDGTGFVLTADLTFTVTYGSAGATYSSMTNTGITDGWVTVLQARGNAVFIDQPIEKVLSDAASITDNDLSTYSLNTQYQSNVNVVDVVGTSVLQQNKDNKIVPKKIKMCANLSGYTMFAFLALGTGDLIPVQEDTHGIDDNYFIQDTRFSITPGGVIMFEWGLVEAIFASETYWELEVVGKSELEETTLVSY